MRKLLAVLLFFTFFLFVSVTLAEQPAGFGKVLGEYDGEQVHYNGPSTYVDSGRSGYGITWQCVEFVQRFWAKRGWGPNRWGADAFQMFDSKPSNATSLENGAGTTPVPGDVLVFSQAKFWPYGHVALVTGVSSGFISFIQQNLGEKWTDKLPISAQNRIDNQKYPVVKGWIHSQKNSAQNGKTPQSTSTSTSTATAKPSSGQGQATATATKIPNQQPIPGATPKQPTPIQSGPTATSTRVPPTATATRVPPTNTPRPPASVTIRTDRTSYRPGDRVLYCYTVSRPAYVTITDYLADGSQQTLVAGNDDGNGDCIEATATPPYGRETLQIDMYDGSFVVATAHTSFTIIQDPVCGVPPAPPNVHEEDFGNVNGIASFASFAWDISPSSGPCKPFDWLVTTTTGQSFTTSGQNSIRLDVTNRDDLCITVFAINSVGQGPGSRYCRPGGGTTARVTIRTDKTTYRVGEQAVYCYTVSSPAHIVITDILADGRQQTILSGNDDGTGDCISGTVTPPYGTEMLRIDMYDGSTIVATANASFTVIH